MLCCLYCGFLRMLSLSICSENELFPSPLYACPSVSRIFTFPFCDQAGKDVDRRLEGRLHLERWFVCPRWKRRGRHHSVSSFTMPLESVTRRQTEGATHVQRRRRSLLNHDILASRVQPYELDWRKRPTLVSTIEHLLLSRSSRQTGSS